jgi:hypothetical protein
MKIPHYQLKFIRSFSLFLSSYPDKSNNCYIPGERPLLKLPQIDFEGAIGEAFKFQNVRIRTLVLHTSLLNLQPQLFNILPLQNFFQYQKLQQVDEQV